jgi:hypothetical protein
MFALLFATIALAAPGEGARPHKVTLNWSTQESPRTGRTSHVLPPNRTVEFCVQHDKGTLIRFKTEGEVGFSPTPIEGAPRTPIAPIPKDTVRLGMPSPPPHTEGEQASLVSCRSFAPFRPGEVWLTVTQTEAAASAPRLALSAADRDRLGLARSRAPGAPWANTVSAWQTPTEATTTDPRAAHLLALADAVIAAGSNEAAVSGGDAEAASATVAEAAHVAQLAARAPLLHAEASALDRALRADPVVKREERVLLLVDQHTVGAVRLGASALWGASSNSWGAVQRPGAASPQITRTAGGPIDVELVASYTQYAHPLSATATAPRLGLNFAVGLADLTDATLGLGSGYLGLDIGWRDLSIAPSLVVRRVDRLSQGSTGGAFVATEADIGLRKVWTPGLALVINAPLELLGVKTRKSEAG